MLASYRLKTFKSLNITLTHSLLNTTEKRKGKEGKHGRERRGKEMETKQEDRTGKKRKNGREGEENKGRGNLMVKRTIYREITRRGGDNPCI